MPVEFIADAETDVEPTGGVEFVPDIGGSSLPEVSALGTLAREAGASVIPGLASAAVGKLGFFAGGGPASPVTGTIGALGGGLVGGLAAAEAQEKVLETVAPEFQQELVTLRQAGQEQHPYAAAVGRFLGALGGFRFQPVARSLPTAAVQAGAAGAATTGAALIQGRAPTPEEIAEGVVQGLLLGESRVPALRIPATATPTRPTPEVTSAVPEQPAAEVLRNVPEQPVQGEGQVPAPEGAGRVPPGDVQPQEAQTGEVSLTPEVLPPVPKDIIVQTPDGPRRATVSAKFEDLDPSKGAIITFIKLHNDETGSYEIFPVPPHKPFGSLDEAAAAGFELVRNKFPEIKALEAGKEPAPTTPAPEPVAVPPETVSGESKPSAAEPSAAEPSAKPETTTKEAVAPQSGESPRVEPARPGPTALKNAMIEQDRKAMGLPPFEEVARQDYREAWDNAMARINQDPLVQDKIIAELKARPRALRNSEESALLHHRMIELKNAYSKASAELAQAVQEGRTEDAATLQAYADVFGDQALELSDITKAAGREWGRTGLARQQLVNDDFSYLGLQIQKRTANGGRELTAKEKTDLQKLASDYEQKMQELQRQLMEATAAKTVAQATVGKKYPPKVLEILDRFADRMDKNAAEASARLKEKLARTSAGIDPTILSDVAIIGAAKITRGVSDFAAWSNDMVRDLGEWIKPELQAAWNASNKLLDEEIKAVPGVARASQAAKAKAERKINATRGELRQLESKFNTELQQDKAKRASIGRKAYVETGRALSSFRTLKTTADLSAVLRQGGWIAAAHPIRASKSIGPMLSAMVSEKNAHALQAQIENRPNARNGSYARGKLYLAPLEGAVGREEAYLPSWIEELPIPGVKQTIAGSQRAYVSFLNKLRADSFDDMAASLRGNGQGLTQQQLEAIGNYINVATGRGNLGDKAAAAEALASVFFSPRLVTSRFQLLAGQPFYHAKGARGLIAQEYARSLMGIGTMIGLGVLAGATVTGDPRSSDFGKMVFGDTRVDPLMGLSQNTVLMARLSTGQKKALSGALQDLRNPRYGGPTIPDVLANFLRSKLAPVPGVAVNIAAGKNIVGEPTTPTTVARDLLVPLSFSDIAEVMRAHDVPEATILSLLSILGMGVQHYEKPAR